MTIRLPPSSLAKLNILKPLPINPAPPAPLFASAWCSTQTMTAFAKAARHLAILTTPPGNPIFGDHKPKTTAQFLRRLKSMSRKATYHAKSSRARLLPPLSAFKVVLSILRGRDSVVSPKATPVQLSRITRAFLKTPPPLSLRISYLQGGNPDARRVLWIHGTPGKAYGWADFLLDVPPGRTYVAIDRPGHGASEPHVAVPSLGLQTLALEPFLGCRAGFKTIVVGHSLGASVALQAALDYPQAVGGLLLLAGAFDPACEEVHWAQSLLAQIGRQNPLKDLLPRSLVNANQELLSLKHSLVAMARRLHEITVPVAIVHGDRGPLVPFANLTYLAQRLVNAPLQTTLLPNRDHFLPWRCKPAVEKALEHLIERVAETGRFKPDPPDNQH